MVPGSASADVPERTWAYDDVIAAEGPCAADPAAGLPSLRFISAALRRRASLWCATAAAGLLLGLGIYLVLPPASEASTSIMLTHITDEKPSDAIQNDATLLESRTVAERAMRKLGLPQSVDSFLAAETVTNVTEKVLVLTVSAPSSAEAARRANALATEFLQFRAAQLQAEQQLVLAALSQQINQDEQQVESIASQITSVSAQAKSPARRAKLKYLQAWRRQANDTLTTSQQAIPNYQVATTSAVEGSGVLDAAVPPPRSGRLKLAMIYAAMGLIPGLALGLGVVIVGALVSDRLRQRDEVAHALGAPVDLSVGNVQVGRKLAAARGPDMQRIVAHLRETVPERSQGAGALAVVAVDNAQVAALALASLAVSCAQQGRQVVVADLCSGAPAARLLEAREPGVRAVSMNGAQLVVAVPDHDDVLPTGPLRRASPSAQPAAASEALAAAYASADLLLTLVTLDPSLGADHLPTWATDAVVLVTAGRSSPTRIHAVGEMIRLAGTSLVSAVLVGADKTDETLGATQTPDPPVPVGPRLSAAAMSALAHRSSKSPSRRAL